VISGLVEDLKAALARAKWPGVKAGLMLEMHVFINTTRRYSANMMFNYKHIFGTATHTSIEKRFLDAEF